MNALLITLALAQPPVVDTPPPVESEAAVLSKPEIKLEPQVFVEARTLVTLTPETNCPELVWTILNPGPGLIRVPAQKPNSFAAVLIDGGPYYLECLGAVGSKPVKATCVLTIGAAPAPAPVPPIPPGPSPGPGPSPPPPADPLFAELQRLYTADASVNKAMAKRELAGVYRFAADLVAHRKAAKVSTTSELFGLMKQASELAMPEASALQSIRQRLAEEHETVFPHAPNTPLDDELRQRAEAYFVRLAQLIDALK